MIRLKTDTKLRLVFGATSVALVAGALFAPAYAHTAVADSSPQDGSTVDAPPEEAWVKFGSVPPPGEQPMAINGGHLEVYDACGEQVSSGETEMNDLRNQLSVASSGNRAGRYELHWTVEAADGEAQSGVIDFNVSAGLGCTRVVRTDPKGDVDFGFDLKSVKTRQTGDVTQTSLRFKKPTTCKAFGRKSDVSLQLGFDVNADDTADFLGVFSCKRGRIKLTVTEAGGDAADGVVFPATLNGRGNVLSADISSEKFSDGEHLDLYALASSEADDCSEEPAEGEQAPVCTDRAPDLGVVRAF